VQGNKKPAVPLNISFGLSFFNMRFGESCKLGLAAEIGQLRNAG